MIITQILTWSPFTHSYNILKEIAFQRTNVVLIVLESFRKEYIGYYNNGKGYTPFDSFNYAIAQFGMFMPMAKIYRSLASFIIRNTNFNESAYISSKYASNQISSIANELDQRGYQTSFIMAELTEQWV